MHLGRTVALLIICVEAVHWVGVGVHIGEVGFVVLTIRDPATPDIVRLVIPERGARIFIKLTECKVDALLSGALSGYSVGKSGIFGRIVKLAYNTNH